TVAGLPRARCDRGRGRPPDGLLAGVHRCPLPVGRGGRARVRGPRRGPRLAPAPARRPHRIRAGVDPGVSGLVDRLLGLPSWLVLVITGLVVFAEDAL